MSAEPWSKWFWTDYETDAGLRLSSLAAQGLWMRMLCLMAKATPKGELRVGGEPCTMSDLAVFVGQSEETVTGLVDELRRRGVFSTTRAGVIYNRRLRKDADISAKRARAGAKGAEVTNQKTNVNLDLPQQNSGKRSSKGPAPEARSQSHKRKEDKPPSREGLPDWLPTTEWDDFLRMRVRIKKPMTELAMARAITELERLRGEGQDAAGVLRQSVDHCWLGLFPVKVREGPASSGDAFHRKYDGLPPVGARA